MLADEAPGEPPRVKVLDFGIARILEAGRTHATVTTQAGTFAWMAPEQSDAGERVSPATDVWALGLIAFFSLTGREYWRASNAGTTHVNQKALANEAWFQPLEAASVRAGQLGREAALPTGFDAWFARCVVREIPSRFRDGAEATEALLRLLPTRVSADSFVAPRVSAPPRELAPTVAMTLESMPMRVAPTVVSPARSEGVAADLSRRNTAVRAMVPAWMIALGSVGAFGAIAVFAWPQSSARETPDAGTTNRFSSVLVSTDVPTVTDVARVTVVSPTCPDGAVEIRGGTFAMGSTRAEGDDDEHPTFTI